jgi:hypothetical protein
MKRERMGGRKFISVNNVPHPSVKREKLVLDWKKRQQTRAGVKLTIEKTLDLLPDVYTVDLFNKKCDLIYKYVYDMKSPSQYM